MKNRKIFSLVILIAAISLIQSCVKDFLDNDYYKKEIFNKQYLDIYGEWKLIESGGGLDGNYQADFDKLLIYEIGNFKKMRNDSLLQKGIIEIREQNDYALKIDFIPLYAIPTSSKWIRLIGVDTLRMDDTCTDCFYHVFARE